MKHVLQEGFQGGSRKEEYYAIDKRIPFLHRTRKNIG